MLTIRKMSPDDIARIGEIDRSEHITLAYKVEAGQIQTVAHEFHVPAWDAEEINNNIEHWSPELQKGGVMLGAFVDEQFAGFAILGHKLFGEQHDQMQLVALYVSKGYRRQGIAERLFGAIGQLAKERGASYLYISATESESAVGFYKSQGSVLAPKVDPELFALEPNDIHLVKKL
jgi:GNAT superfamily N-acetyltransferase